MDRGAIFYWRFFICDFLFVFVLVTKKENLDSKK
jgi:hypothetical protein